VLFEDIHKGKRDTEWLSDSCRCDDATVIWARLPADSLVLPHAQIKVLLD
jgi:hypothetical protein